MRKTARRARVTPPRKPRKSRQVAAKPKQQPLAPAKQTSRRKPPTRFQFDVCVSFAGEVRAVVKEVVSSLKRRRIKCFYDFDEQANLLGKDLFTFLDDVYRKKARFCIMFISEHYPVKLWTNHERQSIQARMFASKNDYLIPVRLDDTEVPGVLPTLGYIDGRSKSPSEIAALIQKKVQGSTAASKPRSKPPTPNAARKVNWTHMTNLRKLRKALNDSVALTLLDLTAARAGQRVMFSDVLRQAGISEARQGMISLGLLTKTIKREFNLPAEMVTWPVERHTNPSGAGQTSYQMSLEVAESWRKSAL